MDYMILSTDRIFLRKMRPFYIYQYLVVITIHLTNFLMYSQHPVVRAGQVIGLLLYRFLHHLHIGKFWYWDLVGCTNPEDHLCILEIIKGPEYYPVEFH